MIKDKKKLYLSVLFLVVSIVLNFPYPHRYPFGESILLTLNMPTKSTNGFHFVGIVSLLFIIVGLILLVKSLIKYRGRFVVIAILLLAIVPPFLTSSYQKTFAKDIDSVAYLSEESNCHFEMVSVDMLHGECGLAFKNYSNKNVQFTVEFHEEFAFRDDLPMVTLMNKGGPYKVSLNSKEYKSMNFETTIDVSNMENHIEGGEATGVDITIKSKDRSREL